MASGDYRSRIGKPVDSNYDDVEALFDYLDEQDDRSKEIRREAKTYRSMSSDAKMEKARLLRKTDLIPFVNARCHEKNVTFYHGGFKIDDNACLKHDSIYFMDNKSHVAQVEHLIKSLKEIGFPEKSIKRHLQWHNLSKPNKGSNSAVSSGDQPGMSVIVQLTPEAINGLIDCVTEERFAPILKGHEKARGKPAKLNAIKGMIEKATGFEIIDEHPEKAGPFTQDLQDRIKSDIRRKVVDELLGPKMARQTSFGKFH